jgi:thiol-disulfide isomerase/thioredoxin
VTTKPRARQVIPVFAIALGVAVAGTAVPSTRAADAPPADGVKLESLKYDAFEKRLAQAGAQKYKLTLVDAWASTCGPCKENFPHLVEMHKKFGGKGLQVVSLSLDDTSDAKALAAARQFLKEKNAQFLNVVLDEEFGVGFEKLNINAIPAVFIYGPDGKEVKRFTMDDPNNQFTYEQVESFVAGQLGGKTASR